jgi:hypothetical protein
MTKPSLSRPRDGSPSPAHRPRLVDSALQALNPAIPIAQIGLSAPPATITSASSSMISRAASPMACAPGGTRRHHRVVRPLEAIADRHLPRDQVDQRARNEERRHPPRPLSFSVMEVSAMDESPPIPDPIRQPVRSWLSDRLASTRILDRLIGGGHAIEDELVDLAGLLRLHPVVGIEGAVGAVAALHFAGIGRSKSGRVEPRDGPRPGLPGQKPRPGFLDTRRQRGHKPQPRHNHSPHVPAPSYGSITSRPDSAKRQVWAIPPACLWPKTSTRAARRTGRGDARSNGRGDAISKSRAQAPSKALHRSKLPAPTTTRGARRKRKTAPRGGAPFSKIDWMPLTGRP